MQVIEPGSTSCSRKAGYRRRRWIDWAVFHVEPQFVDDWLRYSRALKQRNAALKTAPGDTSTVWDAELARLGRADRRVSRSASWNSCSRTGKQAVEALSGLEVELHYLRGWSQRTQSAPKPWRPPEPGMRLAA